MSRIRSIHPGIYTDEAWASVSIEARWLGMGLCTEADDNGVFEWKPIQIKMRLFPADAVDVSELLDELARAGIALSFEADGKRLGALRNFCKYQRPRKPKAWFPITDEIARFVSLPTDVQVGSVPQKSEPATVEGDPVPPESEKSPQMEDGGWRMEKDSEPDGSASVAVLPTAREALTETVWRTCPAKLESLGVSKSSARSATGSFLKAGHPPDAVLTAVDAAVRNGTRDPVPYIRTRLQNTGQAPPWERKATAEADDYLAKLEERRAARAQ